MAAGILVTPLLGGTGFGSQFITVAYNCFVLVIWCLLAYVAYSSRLSPILVFGLGRGASALGTTFGWLAGLEIVRSQGDGSLSLEVISVAMVFALLVVSMLVLNDRLIGDALRPEERPSGRAAGMAAEGLSTLGASAEGVSAEGVGSVGCGTAHNCSDAADGGEGDGDDAVEPRGAGGAGVALPDSGPGDVALGERRPGHYRMRCDAVAERYGLSKRELETMQLVCKGRSKRYIAEQLALSENTVRGYAKTLYAKLDVHSRQELLDLLGID